MTKRKPFHESIVDEMNAISIPIEGQFEIFCRLIAATTIPKDHMRVYSALRVLRTRCGGRAVNLLLYGRAVQALFEQEREASGGGTFSPNKIKQLAAYLGAPTSCTTLESLEPWWKRANSFDQAQCPRELIPPGW
ncbi:MAG: hypothetical protein A3A29_01230 [Candidatus Ryanbacteria bacterium RIFCSPLOWO2_01_FULL_47_79]|uniref:Uncharacterized protein n=1 Tax=Candidatus Ryanbacteria bacterium RIFCSPLOWO2_02_FULL_47_14 TaxID=1802129 RepID=A0A1G2H255_9BACT|nr:MAG: hypothetical protein A2844_00415 [Candidatus Ryanbacteria bacterium RIFCSPHIGHO2_01_FULL_48_80]OGZ52414.1 MAG: hypothetical protein A3A29_01230 [Candidatus Ryanbacteria bacterium RIFCSPLOWO2_01_FULL_47_79]OGZ56321.1 MAG: hypothetical protein A3J04_00340 [Candidatus Ryanbacteria bacterium RIFCSPLOWO2_02_FULL_47_14]